MTQNQDFFNTITPISLSSSPNYSGIATSHIAAGNGMFTYAKTKLATKLVKESSYTINSDLPNLESYIEFNSNLPKIPLDAFYSMLAFYKMIYDKDGTEAQMNFYWNENNIDQLTVNDKKIHLSEIKGLKDWGNGVISYVPIQVNSPSLTREDNDPIYQELRRQMMPFVETHSHNTMSAFKSGTDEQNSYADELQLVIGHITSETFDFYNWVTIRGKQYDHLDKDIVEQIVELPVEYINPSLNVLPNIPEEWIEQHTKARPPKVKKQYFNQSLSKSTQPYIDYDLNYEDYMQNNNDYDHDYDHDYEPYDDAFNHNNVMESFTNSAQKDQKQDQSSASELQKNSFIKKVKNFLHLEKFIMLKNKLKNKHKKG